MNHSHTRCGYIAIIGRPNVGKSTLLNTLLKKKLSITSRKAQTTRHRIMGIQSTEKNQFIYIDTPGIHESKKKLLNQYLNKTALASLRHADIVVCVIDAGDCRAEDGFILDKLQKLNLPVIICLNKTDQLKHTADTLPLMQALSNKMPQAEIIPVSAKKRDNICALEKLLERYLPENDFFFDPATLTDRSDVFVAAEMIREPLCRLLGQELPYASMVSVQSFTFKKNILHIHAVIVVEKDSQKKIVIGKKGETLKLIGQKARLEMEKYFNQKIFLQLWVKVKAGWSQNEVILRQSLQ